MLKRVLRRGAMKALLCITLCATMLLAPFTGNAVTSRNDNVAFTDEVFPTYNLLYRSVDSLTRSVTFDGFNVTLDIDGTKYEAFDRDDSTSVADTLLPIVTAGFAIRTPEGQAWIESADGQKWLGKPESQKLMSYADVPVWLTTPQGISWMNKLYDKCEDHLVYVWIGTTYFIDWQKTPEYKSWIAESGVSEAIAMDYIECIAYNQMYLIVGNAMANATGSLQDRLMVAALELTVYYMYSFDFLHNPYTFDGVTLEVKSELLDDQASVKVIYQLTNASPSRKSISTITEASLGIYDENGKELAETYSIANLPGSTGFTMTGAGAKFTMLAKGNGVTDVSDYWASSDNTAVENGLYDGKIIQLPEGFSEANAAFPTMRFAWRDITLAPGETKSYSVIYKMEVTDPVSVQAPTLDMSFETAQSSSEWSNQPVSYKLTDTVNKPGDVSKYMVKINDGPFMDTALNLPTTVLEQTGEVTVTAVAVSRSGQQSAPVTKFARTDMDKPQVDAAQKTERQYTLFVTDVGSGIASAQYAWGTESAATGSYTAYVNGDVIPAPEDANGTVYLWLKAADKAGNETSKMVKLNAEYPAPAAPKINMNHSTTTSSSEWFSEPITFTLSDSDNASDIVAGYQYKINDGAWTDAKLGETYTALSATGTVTVTAVAVGKNGKDSSEVTAFSRLDLTKPDVSHSDLDQNRQRLLTATDAHSGLRYTGYNWTRTNEEPGSYLDFTSGSKVTVKEGLYGNGYLWMKAVDNAGNETIQSFAMDFGEAPKAPAIAPEIDLSFATTPDTDAWSKTPVTFKIADNLNVPGTIKQYQYKLGNGAWTDAKLGETYTALSESGSVTVAVRCTSIDDVISKETTAFTRMDKDVPVVGVSQNKLIATDAHSGIATAQYAFAYIWDNPGNTPPASFQGTYANGDAVKVPDSMKGVGKVSLWLKATDKAGNETVQKFEYDTGISALADPVVTTNFPASGWMTGDASFTITDPNNNAAVMEKYQYQVDGGAWTDAQLGKEYTASAQGDSITIRVKGFSKFGTETAIVSVTAKVDKDAPVINIAPNSHEGRTVTLSASDALSGLLNAGYAWSASNTDQPASFTSFENGAVIDIPKGVCGTYYLWIKAADKAGNEVVKAFGIDLPEIPVTAPTLNMSFSTTPDSGLWAKEAVTFTITDTQNSDYNVYQYFYRIGDGEWIPAQLGTEYTALSASGTATVSVRALSADGKTYSDEVSLYTQADLDAPAVNVLPNEEGTKLTLSVLDLYSGIATAQYAWGSSNTEAPDEYTDFKDGDKLALPQDVEEASYLWVKTVDNNGNLSVRVVYAVEPEEAPPVVDPDDPTPPVNPDKPGTPGGNTGVDSNAFAWILLASLSGLFALVFVFARKKARA